MGEVDVGLGGDAGEVEARVVAVAGEPVAGAAAIGRDGAEDAVVESAGGDVAVHAGGRIFGERIGAREEEHARAFGRVVERPEFGVAGDEVEALAEGTDVAEHVFADEAHDFPERVAGVELRGGGEAAEEGAVDGRVEFEDDVARDAEPAGGVHGAAGVEPFGGFEPVAEFAGVGVEAEGLEDERERAEGRVVAGELVVVEIVERGIVGVADVHDGDAGVGEVGGRRFATHDGNGVDGEEGAAGEEFVLMGGAGVRENRGEGRHGQRTLVQRSRQGEEMRRGFAEASGMGIAGCLHHKTMNTESPVTMHKISYRGVEQFVLKWTEGGKECEAKFPTEEDAVIGTGEVEERLRVAALAGQGLTVNPFGAHTPFINSKDVHYASLKLQPRGLKFREVIDDHVGCVVALKGSGMTVSAAVAAQVEACKALQPYDTTPAQAVFEWIELKQQTGNAPMHEVLRAYLQAKSEKTAEPPAAG